MTNFYTITPTNYGWGYGYGFFSNYRICLEQLIHHHETGGDGVPYIDWSQTTWVEGFNPFESTTFNDLSNYRMMNDYIQVTSSEIPNGNPFDFWFDQQIPTYEDSVTFCGDGHRPDLIDHSKHYFDEPDQLKRQQIIDKLYIKPKEYILDKINEIYEKEFKGHVVLGVMARGTEYNLHHSMYGVFDVNDYIREINKILSENPQITKLFIVSEDMEYISALSEAFPSSYFVPNVFRRTDETMEYINRVHCWMNISTKRENHCKLLGEETIIQTTLLGKSDYLFGRLSGILAGAVLWGENIKQVFKI
jgi:hypothetical protein